MFDRSLTMRIDSSTDALLKTLTFDTNFSKSELIRRSLRVLQELTEIKKRFGELHISTEEGEKFRLLLS